jgi:two-component system, LytTR family, response regulator
MDRKIRYLIVEDEQLSRETLLKKIELCSVPDIVCVGLASNASEALLLSKLCPPDFVLLDINLPGKNGFTFIEELNNQKIVPQIIFTSAHIESDVLLGALKKSPFTYLVKPIDLDELEAAIKNVCLRIREEKNLTSASAQKIRLNAYNGPVFLKAEQILMVKSELHNSRVHLSDGETVLLNQNIGSFCEDHPLSSPPFYKADRSSIINLNYVEQFFLKKGECKLRAGNYTLLTEISQNGMKKMIELFERQQ